MFQNPKGLKMSIWTGARDESNNTYYLEPQYLREVQLLYGLSSDPIKTLRNKQNVGVGEMTRALTYMATKGVPPALIKNKNGEIIGGWTIDAAEQTGNLFTAFGQAELGDEGKLVDQDWVRKASLFGLTLKRGPRAEEGAPTELYDEVKQAGKVREYIVSRAHQEVIKNPDKEQQIAEKYELTAGERQSLRDLINRPFKGFFQRNRKAVGRYEF
jgi:hypothetical protein